MTDLEVHFTFDGRPLEAPLGASVASALLANGVRSWRRTRSTGAARGLLCGIGNCFDCLVDVGSAHAVRACVTPLHEGDALRTSVSRGSIEVGPLEKRSGEDTGGARAAGNAARALRGDVLVVGGGPAGLAAAEAAIGRGVSVVLVDNAARLGGQLYRQPSSDQTGGARPIGPQLAARHPRLADPPGLVVATGAAVWQLRAAPGGVVAWLEDGRRVQATAAVLAPGVTELLVPFPGWELPGVVSAGAAQSLLKAHGQLVGRRLLVAGSGPFLFPVATSLADAGAEVLAVVEALPAGRLTPIFAALAHHPSKASEAAAYVASLARRGVPIRTNRVIARCEPGSDGALRQAVVIPTVEARDGFGSRDFRGRVYDVDAVCTSYGFVPRLELARQLGVDEVRLPGQPFSAVACDAAQATSVPGVFAAGEVTGIAGGEVAALEGSVAGASAAAYCLGRALRAQDGCSPSDDGGDRHPGVTIGRRLRRARRFAERLSHVYGHSVPLGLISDETVVCRCEDVHAGAIFAALGAGAMTAREVRNVTRCGMGYCQGRTCGPLVQLILAEALGTGTSQVGDLHKRPVATPVPLAVVAQVASPGMGTGTSTATTSS